MRVRVGCLPVTLLALGCAWPAAAEEYLALRFLPAEKPSVYVKLIRDVAWVAASPEGLGDAQPSYADPKQTQKWDDRESGGKGTTYSFRALAIPSPNPHLTVTAGLWVQRIQAPNTQRQRGRLSPAPISSTPSSARTRPGFSGLMTWAYSSPPTSP